MFLYDYRWGEGSFLIVVLTSLKAGGRANMSGSSGGQMSTCVHFSSNVFHWPLSWDVQCGLSTIHTHKAPSWSHSCRHLSVIGVPWDFHKASLGSQRNCSVMSVSIRAPLESWARSISRTLANSELSCLLAL